MTAKSVPEIIHCSGNYSGKFSAKLGPITRIIEKILFHLIRVIYQRRYCWNFFSTQFFVASVYSGASMNGILQLLKCPGKRDHGKEKLECGNDSRASKFHNIAITFLLALEARVRVRRILFFYLEVLFFNYSFDFSQFSQPAPVGYSMSYVTESQHSAS